MLRRTLWRWYLVYETDAKMSDKLSIFPADTHPPVLYPIVLVQGGKPSAQGFVDFLRVPRAARVFRQHGFTVTN